MPITPKALQDILDELKASRASRKRAWEVLQEIRWVLKDTTGIDLPAPARKTIDLEGRLVKDGVRKTLQERQKVLRTELLPTWPEAQKSLLTGRIPKDHPVAEAEASYRFLHEGVLRSYLSKIGQQAGDAAQY